jgi:hypothetical protein
MINPPDLSQNILETQKKVEKLIYYLTECKLKINRLHEENEMQRTTIAEQKKTIELLDKKQRQLKLAKNVSDTYLGTKDVRQEIDHYIAEIDKCIALLST